ncbi:uncharacterized protein LOC105695640 [Orussus abietinus]|uniref:uncharacterized protein LOC105695640 n=1 Tax=Orussus abietinus TaxID=222816 RepID=UPI000625B12D|nr:uncharacterized protein LOC105695640 [Orussus abietinus]
MAAVMNVPNVTQLTMESIERAVEGGLEGNLTLVQVVSEMVQELENKREMTEAEYEQFLADVWVGVVLTLMVLSCVCCMCSCLLYHKFQQWKRHVMERRAAAARDPEGRGVDNESLPSYTLVSGLPSYDEALEQLKVIHAMGLNLNGNCSETKCMEAGPQSTASEMDHSPACGRNMSRLSVAEFLQIYKMQSQVHDQQLAIAIPQVAIAIPQESAKV